MDVASKKKKKNKKLQISNDHEVVSSVSTELTKPYGDDDGKTVAANVANMSDEVKPFSGHSHRSMKHHRKMNKCNIAESGEAIGCSLNPNMASQSSDVTDASGLLTNKQQIRIEKKKKKAAALLHLIKESEECKQSKMRPVSSKTSKNRGKHKSQDELQRKDGTDLKLVKLTGRSKQAAPSSNIASVDMSSGSSCSSDSDAVEANIPQVLTPDELLELRKKLRARQLEALQWPKFFLTLLSLDDRTTLYMQDLHQLLNYALLNEHSSSRPKWCKLLRPTRLSNVVVVILEGLSATEYNEHRNCFPGISSKFDENVEMVSPAVYSSSVLEELLYVSRNRYQLYNVMKNQVPVKTSESKHPRLNNGMNVCEEKLSTEDVDKVNNNELTKELSEAASEKTDHVGANNDAFPRTMLLLSPEELLSEGYPIPGHVKDVSTDLRRGFIFTKEKYTPVTATSPLFAVDCEMCLTTALKHECTRVSVLDENMVCLYDTLVKPRNRIINYLTEYSGITKSMLATVTTRLQDVQQQISQLLPSDAILCGQSLDADLKALKMYHPYVIDTSVIYNISGTSGKTSLRSLANIFLKKNIQNSKDGHCSIEDSSATMELVKLKLSKNPVFGDVRFGYVFDGTEGKNIGVSKRDSIGCGTLVTSTNAPDLSVDIPSNCDVEPSDDYSTQCEVLKLQQLEAFFSSTWKSNTLTESLFRVLDNLHIPVMFLERPCVAELYKDANLHNITVKDSNSDKKLVKMAKTCISETERGFTWLHLYGYQKKVIDKERQDTDYIKKHLQKIDANATDVINTAPAKSLCIIVMPGRPSTKDVQHNACICIKIQR